MSYVSEVILLLHISAATIGERIYYDSITTATVDATTTTTATANAAALAYLVQLHIGVTSCARW